MAISAQQVNELRKITNAGMMDCKRALESSNGDMDAALKFLKEKGLADAKKRGDRETNEGGVFVKENGSKIAVVKIACETDFVANNDNFKSSCMSILDKILESGSDNKDSYTDELVKASSITKEKMEIKDLKLFNIAANQYAKGYIHGNNKIGVVVLFELSDPSMKSKIGDMAGNVAMHIAACNPFYLTPENVPEADVAEQKALIDKTLTDSDKAKPANVLENIINGKINKFKAEICLTEQKYVKDDKVSVKKYVDDTAKSLGGTIKIVSFVRFGIGA